MIKLKLLKDLSLKNKMKETENIWYNLKMCKNKLKDIL